MNDECFLCEANGRCPYFQYGTEISEQQCAELIARSVDDTRRSYRAAWRGYLYDYADYDDVDKTNEIKHILSSLL